MARAHKAQSTEALSEATDATQQPVVEQEAGNGAISEPMSEETIQMEAALDQLPGELAKTFGQNIIDEIAWHKSTGDHTMAGNLELLQLKVHELKRFLQHAPDLPGSLQDHIANLKSMLE